MPNYSSLIPPGSGQPALAQNGLPLSEQARREFGWREWAALPQLRIKRLRVKIDTGARTSALHAFEVLPFERNGQPWVRFGLHLSRKEGELTHWCEAPLLDRRIVTDSGGHAEERHVIASTIVFGNAYWPLAITLTNRDSMRYRMLVGRSGLPIDAQVLPHHAWLQGQPVYDKQAFRNATPERPQIGAREAS